ncbi:hypothetical protein [Staphylococcus equorum]
MTKNPAWYFLYLITPTIAEAVKMITMISSNTVGLKNDVVKMSKPTKPA